MTLPERLSTDYAALGLTTGPHPMALLRPQWPRLTRAADLRHISPGRLAQIGGLVICRQRPGTAKGHLFVSLEDETGIANVFIEAPVFERYRAVIVTSPYLIIRGQLQLQHGVSISLKATHIQELPHQLVMPAGLSHDFH